MQMGNAEPVQASVGCISAWYLSHYISGRARQPAQLADSCLVADVPLCHYTAGDYQSNLVGRNLVASGHARFRTEHGQPSTRAS